jgi:hypothetical protein
MRGNPSHINFLSNWKLLVHLGGKTCTFKEVMARNYQKIRLLLPQDLEVR